MVKNKCNSVAPLVFSEKYGSATIRLLTASPLKKNLTALQDHLTTELLANSSMTKAQMTITPLLH